MAISPNKSQREFDQFRECVDGGTASAVTGCNEEQVPTKEAQQIILNRTVVDVGGTATLLAATSTGLRGVLVENVSNRIIFWGEDNTVTISGATRGVTLNRNQIVFVPAGSDLFAIASNGSNDILVLEFGF